MNKIETTSEDETLSVGKEFSATLKKNKTNRSLILFLEGDLGAGKTTFTKGIMLGLGYDGLVKSPTYNLVEIHETQELKVYHFDLYRIKDPYELEEIGIREYLEDANSVCIFEWPENAESLLPKPDFDVSIEHHENDEPNSRLISIK